MSVRRYLRVSFLAIMVTMLAVFGLGLWLSITLYLDEYLRHLRHLAKNHHIPGMVGASHMGLDALLHFLHAMELNIAVSAVVALVLGWIVAQYVSRSLTRPLEALTRGAHAIGRGATNVEIASPSLTELSQLAYALNDVVQTFKHAEQQRQERLEDLAHEIRTPLTAILSYSHAWIEDTHHDGKSLVTEIERIRQLTNRLPDAAPLSSYFYHFEEVDCEDLVSSVWNLYQPALASGAIAPELYLDPRLKFDADPEGIQEALHNLLANALRHTPRGGTIRLSAQYSEIRGHGVIVVEDSGKGIPEEERERIVGRTIRLDTESRGEGIGLTVVKSIVRAHGGILTIQRSALGGTAVVLTIPLAEAKSSPLHRQDGENR